MDKISGERLQDHWSSGLYLLDEISYMLKLLHTNTHLNRRLSSFRSFENLTIKCKVNPKMVGKLLFSEIVASQTNALNADKLTFVLCKLICFKTCCFSIRK